MGEWTQGVPWGEVGRAGVCVTKVGGEVRARWVSVGGRYGQTVQPPTPTL